MKDMLTIQQVAAVLMVHPQTVRRWVDEGRLSAVDVSGTGSRRRSLRIKTEDLLAFVDRQGGHDA